MISAFGIEHVGKSFVPGGGYKAATKLLPHERHIIGHKAAGNLKAYKAGRTPQSKAPSSAGRQIYSGVKTERGKLQRVIASRSQTGAHGVEGFSRPDGRGGGQVTIHDDADFHTTSRHEMAHIKPKRNPVRMQERLKDPTRLGREEGRADFIGHGGQSTGAYPGTGDFKRGYNEVQGKMAASKWRNDKFAAKPRRRLFRRSA